MSSYFEGAIIWRLVLSAWPHHTRWTNDNTFLLCSPAAFSGNWERILEFTTNKCIQMSWIGWTHQTWQRPERNKWHVVYTLYCRRYVNSNWISTQLTYADLKCPYKSITNNKMKARKRTKQLRLKFRCSDCLATVTRHTYGIWGYVSSPGYRTRWLLKQ
jgi:hypothetical protein